jgi:DNA helicase-2/ATP-dependent DNA helicase PcrA
MPSDLGAGTNAEIEEERRLFNVAKTRAKDDPRLLVPQWFLADGQASKGDRHMYASRTRFILEMLLLYFDRIAWPAATAARHSEAYQESLRWTSGRRCDWRLGACGVRSLQRVARLRML